ncbi:MAG: TetR/AcrR family transcriptional regulator [Pseudonocardiaceae bacterium]|nr:MAG: TetR/AcrR family transcriptional regulator [Pseudonocardiaceae bacterium]
MARTAQAGAHDRILDAASALFYAHGVGAVGTAQVIEAAGCGKNLLYTHFPSKGDLVTAYLHRFRAAREASLAAALDAAGDDPADQLVALVREVADRVAGPSYRGCALRNFLAESPDVGGDAGAVAREYLAASRDRIATLVARLGVADPGTLADRIRLVVEGLYAGAPDPRRAELGDAAVALVRDLVEAAAA